jgi:hypothetical protein
MASGGAAQKNVPAVCHLRRDASRQGAAIPGRPSSWCEPEAAALLMDALRNEFWARCTVASGLLAKLKGPFERIPRHHTLRQVLRSARFRDCCHNWLQPSASPGAGALSGRPMIRRPIEANFYVNVSEGAVDVIFAPTQSRYTYGRLDQADLGLLSPKPVVCAGRKNGTASYEPEEVQAMAHRVALATARRLKRSVPRQLG